MAFSLVFVGPHHPTNVVFESCQALEHHCAIWSEVIQRRSASANRLAVIRVHDTVRIATLQARR